MKSCYSKLARRARAGLEVISQHGLLFSTSVLFLACAVPLLMRLPLRRLQSLLGPVRPRERVNEEYPGRLHDCLEKVITVAEPLVQRGCLCRGVTRYFFLRRAGIEVQLCFGMGVPDTEFDGEGHCWLERDGQPILEKVDPLPRFLIAYRMGADTV